MSRGLSRRTLLAGLSVAGLTACARPPVSIDRPTVAPTGPVADQLDQIMDVYSKNTAKLGVYVRDLNSGKDWNGNGDYSSQSASMAKVMIVAMALRKARADGHPLAFEQQTDASNALINSDNDSADRLWAHAGGADAYQRLANELQMGSTHRDPVRPDWSWTWTSPRDQVTLLERLLNPTPALPDEDRLYALDIMRKTNPTQIWGVGTRRSENVAVQMKDGWVEFKSSDGLWAVNSMGHVEGEGRNYLAAMMCRVPTFDIGKALLDAIGTDLFRVLGTGKL